MIERIKLLGGLVVVLAAAGCHYAPDQPMPTEEQKLALADFNHRQAAMFDAMMDDLEAKMTAAGAYTPGQAYEPKNIYPESHKGLGPIAE